MALYKITTKGDDGKYYANLPSRTIEMKDDEKYLEYFANGGCVIEFMKDETVWGEDLTKYEGFAAAVKTIFWLNLLTQMVYIYDKIIACFRWIW